MRVNLKENCLVIYRKLFHNEREEVTLDPILEGRSWVVSRYLRGSGIEIGALHNPLKIPDAASVKYVDRMTANELKLHYPELDELQLVNVDIIDDGEELGEVDDDSQDFVIANHFIEHCQNPLLALKNMLRVLREDGILYLAIPDKRYTFDIDRDVTSFEHVESDYLGNAEISRKTHFEEWARFVNKTEGEDEIRNEACRLMKIDYSIHFHVWTQADMLSLILGARKYFPIEISLMFKNYHEVIFILTK